jgi:hypothetical protein
MRDRTVELTPLCVSEDEAATVLGCGKSAVRRYIERGLLPTVRYPSEKYEGEPSRRVLIAVADLEAFVLKHRQVIGESSSSDPAVRGPVAAAKQGRGKTRGRSSHDEGARQGGADDAKHRCTE